MPVRIRITLLFTVAVFAILFLLCSVIYYVSYNNRIELIKARLANRAANTAGLLNKSAFNNELVQKVDSTTAFQFRDKETQVYDKSNHVIYSFSDNPGDRLTVDEKVLRDARNSGSVYFLKGKREVVALHSPENDHVVVSATYDEAGRKYLSQLKAILLLSLLGGTVVSFFVGYFVSGRLLLPIKKIADDVNEISAKNLNRRIKTGTSGDEWFYLGETLNSLLNRLQESFEVQRRFISNASHELSTPLTSVSNQLEVSLQRNRDAEEYRNVMRSVQQDVLHMSKLTQTLLEFAKAAGSAGGLEIEPVRVDEIILQVVNEMPKVDGRYSVKIDFENMPADEDQLLVFGNGELLLTAIKNIVLNACKYSTNNQAIVALRVKPEEIIIEITDDGPGISPD
ncbi:MAG TPA: HAMP domain-containing sensor histidine kinase, partial [Ferruginibacter sp.]|nr:HAMP domain-containing sensor histidine kinase [Ferruginibacter sp.]